MDHQGHSVIAGLELTEVVDQRRSAVWRAIDSTGTEVAAKLVEPAYESILPRRFGRQNRSLRRTLATTSGWVPVIDTGVARNGRAYVISPFYQRGSVADQLEHGSTPWYPAANLAIKVATTIGAAHNRGCSFGYLRPSNILYHNAKAPLIAVYGSATRHFDDGTAHFTAPEVVERHDVLPASDVFSISLVFASLIAGREIDRSEQAVDILDEIGGLAPARVLEIIDYGLSYQLQNRFADAAKMARALTNALHEIEVGDGDDANALAEASNDDQVLDELLTAPLVDPMGDSFTPTARQRFSDEIEPDVAVNHPGLPADLQDLTISRLPRPVRSVSEPDVSEVSITADLDGPDTDRPWSTTSEDETGPVGIDGQLDSPTAIPFPPLGQHGGPLSDLLDPIQPKQTRPVDPFDPDPTMDHRQGRVARQEINDLIAEFGYDGAVSRSVTHADAMQGSQATNTPESDPAEDHGREQNNTTGDDTADTASDHDDTGKRDHSGADTAKVTDTGSDAGRDTGSDGDDGLPTSETVPIPDSVVDTHSPASVELLEEAAPVELIPEKPAVPVDLNHAEMARPGDGQTVRPTFTARLVDSVYGLASARRRLAQTTALLGILSAIGFAAVIAIASIDSGSVISGGVPSGSIQADQSDGVGSDDLSSPLNDLSHLDAAEKSSTATTATTTRRRTATTAVRSGAVPTSDSTTTSLDLESSTTSFGDITTTTLIDGSTSSPDLDLTTTTEAVSTTSSGPSSSSPSTTEQTTTTVERTTTTEDVTTTTKKKRKRPRP